MYRSTCGLSPRMGPNITDQPRIEEADFEVVCPQTRCALVPRLLTTQKLRGWLTDEAYQETGSVTVE